MNQYHEVGLLLMTRNPHHVGADLKTLRLHRPSAGPWISNFKLKSPQFVGVLPHIADIENNILNKEP